MYPTGGYPQTAYQPAVHPNGPYRSGPPPAKKPRSNLIITRYPPPPGYRGPAQPQTPFTPGGWQQPTTAYGYGNQQFQPYQQSQYHPHQQSQYQPQPTYQGFQTHQFPPTPASYYPSPAQSWPGVQPGWETPLSSTHNAPHMSWQNNPAVTEPSFRRHSSAQNPTDGQAWAGSTDGNVDAMSVHEAGDFPQGSTEDLESDFDGECCFSRCPEEINPELSLGLIEWKAPRATIRALPPTFKEAQLDEIAPRPSLPSDGESVSDYFIHARRHEAFLSIRQTDAWHQLKHDLIFREFLPVCKKFIPRRDLIQKYRCRFDQAWFDAGVSPATSRASTPGDDRHDSASYPSKEGECSPQEAAGKEQQDDGMLDKLEIALFSDDRKSARPSDSMDRPRNGSTVSQNGGTAAPLKHLWSLRDQKQEDVLAALGVTGSPKSVFQTPGPAFGPPPQSDRNNTMNFTMGGVPKPPPPPPGQPAFHHERYNSVNSIHGYASQRPRSAESQQTAPGSDFEDDGGATPRPPKHDDSRKRSFYESEGHDSDATPRHKQRRVDNAFNRR